MTRRAFLASLAAASLAAVSVPDDPEEPPP